MQCVPFAGGCQAGRYPSRRGEQKPGILTILSQDPGVVDRVCSPERAKERLLGGAEEQPVLVVLAQEVEPVADKSQAIARYYFCATTWNGQSLSHMQRLAPKAATTRWMSGARSR